jgi:hypothetical protein
MIDLNMISWELRKKLGIPTCDGVEGPCHRIGKHRRQNTAYIDDERNLVYLCDQCFELNQAYWDEMWSNVEGYKR